MSHDDRKDANVPGRAVESVVLWPHCADAKVVRHLLDPALHLLAEVAADREVAERETVRSPIDHRGVAVDRLEVLDLTFDFAAGPESIRFAMLRHWDGRGGL